MKLVTVVVRSKDDGKDQEISFSVVERRQNQTLVMIRDTVNGWSRFDNAAHTVVSTGKTFGQQITIQLQEPGNDTRVRRTAVDASNTLKQELERKGMAVNPSKPRDYSAHEGLADVGLPKNPQPVGGVK